MAIRPCADADFDAMLAVINAAAPSYGGVIPPDLYQVPFVSAEELRDEIAAGVRFWGWYEGGELGGDGELGAAEALWGPMGIQDSDDVTLIRHAYVLPEHQGTGIGSRLLAHLTGLPHQPLLVSTWADAARAIRFCERHGFRLLTPAEKVGLRRYWRVSDRQAETSVVLGYEGDVAH